MKKQIEEVRCTQSTWKRLNQVERYIHNNLEISDKKDLYIQILDKKMNKIYVHDKKTKIYVHVWYTSDKKDINIYLNI